MPVFTWVLHLDLDQFIAAVELQRHPQLRGKPVIVGGDGNPARRRQVVATASFEARRFGVRSGMPLSIAARRCPDAVFLPHDRAAYDAASENVWRVVRELDATVEVWGWDEGYLGTNTPDPVGFAQRARALVHDRTGLTCCIGVGDNKLTAKLATGFAKAKPGEDPADAPGVAVLTRGDWLQVMGDRPADAVWGIGPRTAGKLAEMGIATVSQLAQADESTLAQRFGPTTGPWLRMLGNGYGERDVTAEPWVPKGRSHEETYPDDIVDRAEIVSRLRRLAHHVGSEVIEEGRIVTHVAIKVRFAPFLTSTRVTKLASPTSDPVVVADTAVRLLDRYQELKPVRLLGVRVDLAP